MAHVRLSSMTVQLSVVKLSFQACSKLPNVHISVRGNKTFLLVKAVDNFEEGNDANRLFSLFCRSKTERESFLLCWREGFL